MRTLFSQARYLALSLIAGLSLMSGLTPDATANPALAGHWHGEIDGQTVRIQLEANGTGISDGVPIRYQTMGRLLLVERQGQVITYGWELKNNQLHVGGGDLPSILVLKRGQAPAPSTNAGANNAGANNAGAGSGGVLRELVGKWCEVKNFSANAGGGSASSSCFELRADGSYVYASERSMSAYAPGMYGGTSSGSNDAGRWSATASSITARSQRGTTTTYRLEKRNHPRNGDPMLCLDGDCYVTYYQKRPW